MEAASSDWEAGRLIDLFEQGVCDFCFGVLDSGVSSGRNSGKTKQIR